MTRLTGRAQTPGPGALDEEGDRVLELVDVALGSLESQVRQHRALLEQLRRVLAAKRPATVDPDLVAELEERHLRDARRVSGLSACLERIALQLQDADGGDRH